MSQKTFNLPYKDNAQTMGRIMMLFNLYWPGIKPGILICAIYPFVAYIVAVLADKYAGLSFEWLVGTPIVALLCGSPIMLAKHDYRPICAQLPVSRFEKFSFLFITFFIAVPLILNLSLNLSQPFCDALFHTRIQIPVYNVEINGLTSGIKIPQLLCLFLTSWPFISVVLFYVVKSKNRTLAAFLSFFGVLFFFMIAGIVIGIIGVIREDIGLTDTSYITIAITAMTLVFVLIGVVYLVKLFKYLRNHGF